MATATRSIRSRLRLIDWDDVPDLALDMRACENSARLCHERAAITMSEGEKIAAQRSAIQNERTARQIRTRLEELRDMLTITSRRADISEADRSEAVAKLTIVRKALA